MFKNNKTLAGATWMFVFIVWVTFHALKVDAPRLDDTLAIVSTVWVGTLSVKQRDDDKHTKKKDDNDDDD